MDRIEEINLPSSIVVRLIKEALPEGVNLNKDAKTSIARAASVFIIFLTSASTTLARQEKHKSIHTQNILNALTELDLESFIEPIEQDLEVYRRIMKSKKDNKSNNKKAAAATESSSINTNGDKNGNGNVEIIEDEEAEANIESDGIVETETNGNDDMEEDEEEEE